MNPLAYLIPLLQLLTSGALLGFIGLMYWNIGTVLYQILTAPAPK